MHFTISDVIDAFSAGLLTAPEARRAIFGVLALDGLVVKPEPEDNTDA